MAKSLGRVQTFTWNSNTVNGIVDGSYELSRASVDVTVHDSGDAKAYLQAQLEGTISLTCKHDEADAGQSGLQDDIVAGTARAVNFKGVVGAGSHQYTGTAIIEKVSGKYPLSDAAEVSYDLKFSGTITQGVQ